MRILYPNELDDYEKHLRTFCFKTCTVCEGNKVVKWAGSCSGYPPYHFEKCFACNGSGELIDEGEIGRRKHEYILNAMKEN